MNAGNPVPAVLNVQVVEEVRACGGDGAVAEVEDARCLVRQDEAGGREAVDRTGRDAADDERQVAIHRCCSPDAGFGPQ